MRASLPAVAMIAVLLVVSSACSREAPSGTEATGPAAHREAARAGSVTIRGDDRIAGSLTWEVPEVVLPADGLAAAQRRADEALAEGRLYEDADAAIPLLLAIQRQAPDDAAARHGMERALAALLAGGDEALARADDDVVALRESHRIAAVARRVAPQDPAVQAYLGRVDATDRGWELNRQAEQDLEAGRLGESGNGALAKLREVLRLKPRQPRAMQGMAAVESGLIRRAEQAGARGDFRAASRWLGLAGTVRPGSDTIADARARIAAMRSARIGSLHDAGLEALQQRNGLAAARARLDEILRIAEPGDAAAADLRQRIDLAAHYGLFRPGQRFTDGLAAGARGPEMVVVPHGAFGMGAADNDVDGTASERPQHYVRFDRGFALSRTEVTVGQFRRFVAASGYRPTATRRGHSLVYEERSGNFVRRSGVDWRSAYDGSPAGDDLPVLHVSARDADAYAAWLSAQSGERYHVPSEAQFEYALRAGGGGRYPWGYGGVPPRGAGNVTTAGDRSPSGRHWGNAFPGAGDGYWGPAPVARFAANAYALHDLAGNVSEWVADCWHDGFRRAPANGAPWVNPGCRTRVVRGGAWCSAPVQVRSSWRSPAGVDTTNARVGFRVAREL